MAPPGKATRRSAGKMRVRVLRSPQCVALIGRAPGRETWRLRVRVPSQSATCSRAKAAKANRWGLISPVDSRNCFRQGYSSAAIRSMRTNGTCGCDSHCPAYGLLATIGRAPALQAGGCGFESRTVHGCSRKRCSYIAARCPPGLPSFIDRWLSWLERLVYTQKVIGSSPVRSTGGVASELCQFCPHVFVGAR